MKKSNYEKNRLEYFKKHLVRFGFGFGFVMLKPINPNQTEPVQIKRKGNINPNQTKSIQIKEKVL